MNTMTQSTDEENEEINGIASKVMETVEDQAKKHDLPTCVVQSAVNQKFVVGHLMHVKAYHGPEAFEDEVKALLKGIEYARNV